MKMRLKRTAIAAGIALIASGAAYADLNNGLVAYYPFSGNANDESSNENHGTVNGATLTEDRFGNADGAYLFDGVGDYINVGHSTSLDVNHHTIASWIKADSSSEIRMILGKVNPSVHEAINFYLPPDNYVSTSFATGSEVNHHLPGSSALENEQWHFVAMTYDGEKVTLYVNGVIDAIYPRNGVVRTNGNDLAIGKHGGDEQGLLFFHGRIDDVRIYNRPLSETEIQELYSEEPPLSCSDEPATYSNETRQAILPCVEIPLYTDVNGHPLELTAWYATVLEIPFGFSDFEVKELTFLEIVETSNPRHARFNPDSGILDIPRIDIPTTIPLLDSESVPGPALQCSAALQQSTLRPEVLMLEKFDCQLP